MSVTAARVQQEGPRSSPTGGQLGSTVRSELVACVAAGLSLVAALIHLWILPEHFVHWWVYGAFFVTSAFAQGLSSILVTRWPSNCFVLLASIAGNLLVIVTYVVARTWGVLFGPGFGQVGNSEVLGMVATAAEVGTLVAMVALLGGAYRRVTLNAILLAGALLWGLTFWDALS